MFADPEDTNDKHTTFSERAEQLQGKLLAMNFRRLPLWVLSRAQHVSRWRDLPRLQADSDGSCGGARGEPVPRQPDPTLTDEGRFGIDRWLRTESITEDFLGFISEFTEVTDEQRKQVHELGPVNTHDYDKDVTSWFTPDLIERMYERTRPGPGSSARSTGTVEPAYV